MLAKLISLANRLDQFGSYKQADIVDRLIVRYAQGYPTTSAKVIIDPQLRGRIENAIEKINAAEPDLLRDVTHIYALHTSNFGQWKSDQPTAIYVNLDLIEQRIRQLIQQGMDQQQAEYSSIEEEVRDAIQKQLALTLGHEAGHAKDIGRGGEPSAEAIERRLEEKV